MSSRRNKRPCGREMNRTMTCGLPDERTEIKKGETQNVQQRKGKKKTGVRLALTGFILAGLFLYIGCGGKKCRTVFTGADEYGSYQLGLTKEEYLAEGFELGDAFRIEYTAADGSREVLEDVPCVSAYTFFKKRGQFQKMEETET